VECLQILYADPVFAGVLLAASAQLYYYVHVIDAICLARAVGDYCIREVLPDLSAGVYDSILPIPGHACYDALNAEGNTCPPCANTIRNLTTAHGCCAIVLYRFAGLARATTDPTTLTTDNRDDPTFPANIMIANFESKCSTTATQITKYCTAVAVNFRLTLHNIAVAAYAADVTAFHALVVSDIAEFLGMVESDISVASSMAVQSSPWYSSFVPSSFISQDDEGVELSINVMPDNDDAGSDINTYVTTSLATGSIPFPNTASNVQYLNDPTVEVTSSQSSASTLAASCLLIVGLMLIQL
jgi:hypothetical protein